jgi:hypothetical protein
MTTFLICYAVIGLFMALLGYKVMHNVGSTAPILAYLIVFSFWPVIILLGLCKLLMKEV